MKISEGGQGKGYILQILEEGVLNRGLISMYRVVLFSFFILCICGSVNIEADTFTDNFNASHDYLAEGVAGTGWDGFVGLGAGETVNKLNASIDRAGKLYMESTNARWEPNFNPLGPFLYKIIAGDFTATVKVEDSLDMPWNCVGIMARVGELALAGSGEDFECVDHFISINSNMVRAMDNGSESETPSGSLKQYLRLRRVGSTFYHEASDDGTNWTVLPGSPRIRTDMAGLPLQVGLQHANYNLDTTYVVYEDFSIETFASNPYANNPNPEDTATDVILEPELSWSPGYLAESHDVYFGTNFDDVNNADNTWPVGGVYKGNQPFLLLTYSPGLLVEGRTYYWRIDEVGDSNIWKGEVWEFRTYSNKLDDFESYSDSGELNNAWVPAGSATVTLSTSLGHKSAKSMQLGYANGSGPYYSAAKMTFDSNSNWGLDEIEAISIYFKGSSGNDADKLYVIIEDGDWIPGTAAVRYDGDTNDLKNEYWQRWDISLEEFVEDNSAFRLEKVRSVAIAVGDMTNPQAGGTGTIYIDDIVFKGVRCVDKNRPVADFDGDCDVDTDDLKYLVDRWLGTDFDADLIEDESVDFKDYAVAADKWLGEYEKWPVLLDQKEFLDPVPYYDVNITGGLWAERMETDRTVTIPHNLLKLETEERINNLRKAAGLISGNYIGYVFNDSDVYKVIEAVGYSLRLHPDAALEATADDIIDIIEAAQWEDGYLNSYYTLVEPENRWTNIAWNHELYCAGHLFEGAVAYYQTTGKDKILNVSTKFVDHLLDVFGPGKNMYPPGHQEVELALIKLYHLLGDERYFDLAKFFIDERGNAAGHSLYGTYSQDHVPLIEQDSGVGHAVRACYFYSGAADVARVNLDQDYMSAMLKVWDNIVSAKTYIIGGLGQPGGPEGFTVDYDLGNNSYCETCASIAFSNWNHRMFLLTGDGKYLDMMERSALNNILSGVSLSGDHFFYPNALESSGASRPDWYGCACCPPNLARYIMSIGEKAYAHNDGELYVNLYIEGSSQIPLAENTVNLSVDTNYPWDGDIQITVNPAQSATFPIYLRIPCWARNIPMPGNLYDYVNDSNEQVTLEVNGSPVELNIEKGFAKVERNWSSGDTIHLVLPMPVRKVVAHPNVTADAGLVVIERGPVVYCAEGIDNGGSVYDIIIDDGVEFSATYEQEILRGVVVLRSAEPNVTLVPYYTWANRGSTPMKVWLGGTFDFEVSEGQIQGYWKLDEASGTTANDSSGKGMNGTCVNGLSFTNDSVTGKFDKAIDFDGADDYIDLPDGFADFSKGITISVWACPTAVKNYARFVDIGNGSASDNIAFSREGLSNNLFCEVWVGGSNGGRVLASNAIELNKWQMFTVVVDASGNAKIYKDAQAAGYGKTGSPKNITRTNNYIGRSNWGGDAYYQGYMDEVRIFDYAMDANGVEALYYGGRAENPSPADDSNDISVDTVLTWIAGSSAAEHDVYLGADYDAVSTATPESAEHKERQAESDYTPIPALDSATEYFWRIDEVTASEQIIPGVVWSFRTAE